VGQHGVFLAAAPIWTALHLPILAYATLQAMAALVTLIRPDWVRVRAAVDIVVDLGGLALVAALWSAGRLFTAVPSGVAGPKAQDLAGLQAALDQSFQITIGVMAVVFLGKLVVSAWRLARGAPIARPATV
jgi:hypothetical protein